MDSPNSLLFYRVNQPKCFSQDNKSLKKLRKRKKINHYKVVGFKIKKFSNHNLWWRFLQLKLLPKNIVNKRRHLVVLNFKSTN